MIEAFDFRAVRGPIASVRGQDTSNHEQLLSQVVKADVKTR